MSFQGHFHISYPGGLDIRISENQKRPETITKAKGPKIKIHPKQKSQ